VKLYLLIFIISLTSISLSFAESSIADSSRIFINYCHEYYTINRGALGYGIEFIKGIHSESTIIGISQIAHDPYNHGKKNCSIAPIGIALVSALPLVYAESKRSKIGAILSSIPLYLTNTTIYVPLQGHADVLVHIAPFIKNDTDYYMFRDKKWGQTTPGAGLRIYFRGHSSLDESGIAVGVERAFQSDFKGETKKQDLFFFRAGFNVNFAAAMSV